MRLPLYALAVSGATLVQGTVVPVVGIGGVVPDIPVILVNGREIARHGLRASELESALSAAPTDV